jgi:hypothetical protein
LSETIIRDRKLPGLRHSFNNTTKLEGPSIKPGGGTGINWELSGGFVFGSWDFFFSPATEDIMELVGQGRVCAMEALGQDFQAG